MNTRQRQILEECQSILHWLKGSDYSYAEIGRVLGVTRESISRIASGKSDCTGESVIVKLRSLAKQEGMPEYIQEKSPSFKPVQQSPQLQMMPQEKPSGKRTLKDMPDSELTYVQLAMRNANRNLEAWKMQQQSPTSYAYPQPTNHIQRAICTSCGTEQLRGPICRRCKLPML